MNTFDMAILSLLRDSLKRVETDFKALVIHNEADNFSAGANLGLLMTAIRRLGQCRKFDQARTANLYGG